MKSESLEHIAAIKSLILTVRASERMHALIIEGPPGWGKTTTVDEALRAAEVTGVHLGSYSTALHLFNFLYQNSQGVVVIDDCAGLFGEQSALAILKSATWGQARKRKIRWGSTSGRAAIDEFFFEGKLIVICNSFPSTPDAEAVKSRSFPYKIDIDPAMAKKFLEEAAENTTWYPNTERAREVAQYLSNKICTSSIRQISYRTLQMGYELAQHNSEQWRDLLERMITCTPDDPKKVVRQLSQRGIKVKEQARLFEVSTGLKRRTFFKYRRALSLSKS